MWTMPRPVLLVVAVLLGLVAAGGLGLGFVSAPERGRLPGESAQGGPASAVIEAPDATPIVDAPPPPPPEETEKEKSEEEEVPAEAKLVERAPPPAPPPVVAPEPTEPIAPPPVEPESPLPPSEIPPF
jgi:hypothetical protein